MKLSPRAMQQWLIWLIPLLFVTLVCILVVSKITLFDPLYNAYIYFIPRLCSCVNVCVCVCVLFKTFRSRNRCAWFKLSFFSPSSRHNKMWNIQANKEKEKKKIRRRPSSLPLSFWLSICVSFFLFLFGLKKKLMCGWIVNYLRFTALYFFKCYL